MEDEAHLNVIAGLIDAVQRLQAGNEDCNHSYVQNHGVENEDLAVKAASETRKCRNRRRRFCKMHL
jgi:hypothetical protein